MMRLQDVPVGGEVMMIERMDGGEVRHTRYRRAYHPVHSPKNVAVFRLRTTQGTPGEPPRYDVINSRPYPSEAHGLTPVVPAAPWY